MPAALIARANDILAQLENKHLESAYDEKAGTKQLKEKVKQIASPQMQLSIFDVHSQTFEEIRQLLEEIDINRLTPVEALLKLQQIKNKVL